MQSYRLTLSYRAMAIAHRLWLDSEIGPVSAAAYARYMRVNDRWRNEIQRRAEIR